jgi:membrane protein YdbS with pleckstrin-like domain
MSVLPPELMSADEREARAAEIQAEIPRQWVRFAITEAVVIWLPFGTFVTLYAADAVPDSLLVPAIVVAATACVGLTLYWVFMRVQPLQRELQRIEGD